MKVFKLNLEVCGPRLYSITDLVEAQFKKKLRDSSVNQNGVLHLFNMHTSCALLINESYDDTAKEDLQSFFDYLAPNNLNFIKHTLEGEDDSPAHMKSSVLQQNLSFVVENGELLLGQWQGIFLAEFRRAAQSRSVLMKYQPDCS